MYSFNIIKLHILKIKCIIIIINYSSLNSTEDGAIGMYGAEASCQLYSQRQRQSSNSSRLISQTISTISFCGAHSVFHTSSMAVTMWMTTQPRFPTISFNVSVKSPIWCCCTAQSPSQVAVVNGNPGSRVSERDVIRLGLPSKGRMSADTLELLKDCQLSVKQVNPRQYVVGIPKLSHILTQPIPSFHSQSFIFELVFSFTFSHQTELII